MTKTRALIFAALISALPSAPAAAQAAPESITYETTPCFGFCPVYRVTIDARGNGLFQGRHHTRIAGERRFRVPPARYAALVRALAPIRPRQGRVAYDQGNRCGGAGAPPTDGPGVIVEWRAASGTAQSLSFYTGCPQPDVRHALAAASRLLALGPWIAPPPSRRR